MASFQQKIESFIDSKQNISDLVSILKHFSLQSVREMVKNQMKSMDPESIKKIYYDSMPLDTIISPDSMQSILSYTPHQHSNQYLNKSIYQLIHKNKAMASRLRKEAVASHFKENSVWMVDPERDELDEQELQKGIKGPLKSLDDALKAMESGDKIVLAEGEHILEDGFAAYNNKDIQIEGVGECVLSLDANWVDQIQISGKLSMLNIVLQKCLSNGFDDDGMLWLTDCIVRTPHFIYMSRGSSLDCMNVLFHRRDNEYSAYLPTIMTSSECSVSIKDCMFVSGGGYDEREDEACPCIEIHPEITSLELVGNSFEKLQSVPIGITGSEPIELDDRITMNNNYINLGGNDILYAFFVNKEMSS